MPIDDRLRDSLRRNASVVEPDVEHHLEQVVRRSWRGGRASGSLVALAASIVALLVLVRVGGIDPLAVLGPMQGPAPSPSSVAHPLPGTYRVTLDGSDSAIGTLGMGGEWTITLGGDSSLSMAPPASFQSATGRAVYAVAGDLLHTNALARDLSQRCAGSGTYRWERTADGLRFELRDDVCPARVALFTSAPWMREVP